MQESVEREQVGDLVAAVPHGERVAIVREALRAQMIAALSGRTACVPVVLHTAGRRAKILSLPVKIALSDALDLSACANELLTVLRESRCPQVAGLRTVIATQYAQSIAAAVADSVEAQQ